MQLCEYVFAIGLPYVPKNEIFGGFEDKKCENIVF